MDFLDVCQYLERIEGTSSRLMMTGLLVELFSKTPDEDVDKVAYLCLGQFTPEYSELDLGFGDKTVMDSIAIAAHTSRSKVEQSFKKTGDLGLTAESMMGEENGGSLAAFTGTSKKLTVSKLFEQLTKIAKAEGKNSQRLKMKTLAGLLISSSKTEARYIARLAVSTLRLGSSDMTLLDALTMLYTLDKKELETIRESLKEGGKEGDELKHIKAKVKENRELVESAYYTRGDIGMVAKKLATGGLDEIKKIKIVVGIPIKMMAAQRVETLDEIPKKMPSGFAVEEKYDGERVQIHKDGEKVSIYSRRLENITEQYPDVVKNVRKNLKSEKAIVEGEVVAVKNGKLQPFQFLMQRKRKYDIEKYAKNIPVTVFLFDLIYEGGESYLRKSYVERRSKLDEVTKKTDSFILSRRTEKSKPSDIEAFFEEALVRGCEGIMAKSTSKESIYRAREWLWIKYKQDYKEGLVDTIDVTIIGALYGKGKRSGNYGTLLAAVYNKERDMFESICRVASGLTDELLGKLPDILDKYKSKKKPARIDSGMEPDVWFKPGEVAEIVGAEITESPVHRCGIEEMGKGLAIRFPRFKRFRDDKGPDESSTTREIIQMYEKEKG